MTLLIKNVQILGGEGSFSGTRDVFVTGDKISAIGDLGNKKADEVIDGQGAYLSPGFIDINTDSDHYLSLLDHPEQEDFLRQGVTTIIGGMCGSSLAPLIYGSLESVQKWGDIRKVNVGWHSMGEFLETLDKKQLAVNFATLVGHATIRRAIAGDKLRDLTKNELAVFANTLRRALEEGGIGLSTGLSYVHAFRTPYSELKSLASVTKEYDGLYATHLRKNGAELGESIDETIKLVQETGVKAQISHFMPLIGAEKNYEAALKSIGDLSQETDLHFDVYPFDVSILALYTFLPQWVQSGGKDVMLANLKDEWLQTKIEKDLPEFDPAKFVVASAPGNEHLVGHSLKDLEGVYNVPTYRAALLKFMLTTELKGVIFYRNINKNLITSAIQNPRSLIASNAASFPDSAAVLKAERETKTFTEFLKIALEKDLMPLEAAVKKITADAARKANLKNRGAIKEGNFADLALFSVKDVTPSDGKNAASEKNVEIKCVVVNGEVVFKTETGFTGRRAGRVLRRAA